MKRTILKLVNKEKRIHGINTKLSETFLAEKEFERFFSVKKKLINKQANKHQQPRDFPVPEAVIIISVWRASSSVNILILSKQNI